MTQPDRIKRPIPERTKPNRNVLGALGQSDAMRNGAAMETPQAGGHPLGPGFNEPSDDRVVPDAAITSGDHLGFIDEGVRAASELVDAHIRQGEETAKALGKGAASIPLGQADVSGLLTGLVRAYSDVASIWVDIVGSLAQKVEGVGQRDAAPQGTSVPAVFGLSIICEGSVEASFEMFRAEVEVVPQPLVASGEAAGSPIEGVRFETGGPGKPGKISVTVPKMQSPGTYHGILLSVADQSPVGVLTLRVTGVAEP